MADSACPTRERKPISSHLQHDSTFSDVCFRHRMFGEKVLAFRSCLVVVEMKIHYLITRLTVKQTLVKVKLVRRKLLHLYEEML